MQGSTTPPGASSAPPDPGDNDEPEVPSTSQVSSSQTSASQPPASQPAPAPVEQENVSNVYKISVPVPREAVGFIIGKRGETVRNMMSKSQAFIAVDRDDTNPNADVRLFHVEGDRAAVGAAYALIREKVAAVLYGRPNARVQEASVTPLRTHSSTGKADIPIDDEPLSEPLEMWIPRGCVGMIIGHGGQVINEMQEKAGATIVVHNSQMDSSGSKLLTIMGGEREKQHAKELIQNILDRAGLRNRYSDHPLQARDTQWGYVPPHPAHPWYFGHPHNPMHFDPRQMSPEFAPRYPPPMQWFNPMHMSPQHQGQPSTIVPAPPLQQETPQPSHPQQPTTPTLPPSQQQVQLHHQIQLHQQNQQLQQMQQQFQQHTQPPQQIQQTQQGSQQQQQTSHQPGTPQQQQAQQLPSQMRPTPIVPGTHVNPHVSSLYPQQLSPSGQPLPWNAGGPYAMAQHMSVPYEGTVLPTQPIVKSVTKAVHVPSSCVGIVIGRNGETIRDLQQRSGAHIKVTPDRDARDDASHRIIYISGTPTALDLAQSLVNDVINEGLTRSYRDGVEPRSSSDPQGSASHDDHHEHDSSRPSDTPPSEKVVSQNGEQSTEKREEKKSETTNGEQHDFKNGGTSSEYKEDVSFPELGATHREGDAPVSNGSELASEAEKKKDEGETEEQSTQQAWRNRGVDESEQYEQLQGEDEEDQDAESYSVPFVGEGRLVQRPATNYPSNSISFEMKIPHAKVGIIIGKRGSTIRLLQQRSGARIVVSKKIDTTREDNPRAVTITGPEPFVENARRLIIAKINPPSGDQGKGDEREAGLEHVDFEEGVPSDDAAMNSLAMDLASQSLNSPLPPPMVVGSAAAPMSPMGVAHTAPYATYQRPMPFVGPMSAVPYSTVTHYQNIRPMMRREVADYRPIEAQGPQHGQFSPQFLGPHQFAEQMPVTPGYAFSSNPESGEMLRGGAGEYRPDQFYGHTGNNFGGMGMDNAGNVVMERGGQTVQPGSRQEIAGEEVSHPYQGEEFEQQRGASSSAS